MYKDIPVPQKKLIQRPRIEYIDEVVTQDVPVPVEKTVTKPVVQYQERVSYRDVPVTQENIVEVPRVEYVDKVGAICATRSRVWRMLCSALCRGRSFCTVAFNPHLVRNLVPSPPCSPFGRFCRS